jgi:hypothetical protein
MDDPFLARESLLVQPEPLGAPCQGDLVRVTSLRHVGALHDRPIYLDFICIPASIERISGRCFDAYIALHAAVFEPNSKAVILAISSFPDP